MESLMANFDGPLPSFYFFDRNWALNLRLIVRFRGNILIS